MSSEPGVVRSVCVFCGSKPGDAPAFMEAAHALGAALAAQGLVTVYGGARSGLMGALADGALSRDGTVVGVIPRGLARQEFAHPGLTEAVFVETMAERKQLMIDRADAFLALPGGFGTLDELFEVLTGAQIGLHQKPGRAAGSGRLLPAAAPVDRPVVAARLHPQRLEGRARRRARPRAARHLHPLPPAPSACGALGRLSSDQESRSSAAISIVYRRALISRAPACPEFGRLIQTPVSNSDD